MHLEETDHSFFKQRVSEFLVYQKLCLNVLFKSQSLKQNGNEDFICISPCRNLRHKINACTFETNPPQLHPLEVTKFHRIPIPWDSSHAVIPFAPTKVRISSQILCSMSDILLFWYSEISPHPCVKLVLQVSWSRIPSFVFFKLQSSLKPTLK